MQRGWHSASCTGLAALLAILGALDATPSRRPAEKKMPAKLLDQIHPLCRHKSASPADPHTDLRGTHRLGIPNLPVIVPLSFSLYSSRLPSLESPSLFKQPCAPAAEHARRALGRLVSAAARRPWHAPAAAVRGRIRWCRPADQNRESRRW